MVRRYTTEEWIAKAKTKHGELYDYSKVDFKGQQYKVIIGCPYHGDFEQNAGSHTNQGCGCPRCAEIEIGNKRRLKIERFLQKAVNLHGEKYDYSRVEYKTAKTLVTIGCKACGSWFEQSPDKHTNAGRGCWDCGSKGAAVKQRLSTKEFISIAKNIHGELGDYTNTIYIRRLDDVAIYCKACKIEFKTNAGNHLNGQFGCKNCRYTRTGDSQRKSLDEWISDAKSIHGDDYDYSNVIYRGNKKKVSITCNTCNLQFRQEAKSHILGQGCPICRYDKVSEKRKIPLEQILQRCKEVHGERWGYDWKGNEYKNTKSKLPINCEEHGIFFQSVQKHLAGQGCPSCAIVGYDPSKPGYYYVHEILNSDGDILYYKAGISGDWERRLSELSSGLPQSLSIHNVSVVYFEDGMDAREIESKILTIAKDINVKAPPRNFDGGHELFLMNPLEFAQGLFF